MGPLCDLSKELKMNKFLLLALLIFSFATSAQAARKASKQPIDRSGTSDSCSPAYGGCDEDSQSNDDQSSNSTSTSRSGTYEGNDRDTGSDYVNGMPY